MVTPRNVVGKTAFSTRLPFVSERQETEISNTNVYARGRCPQWLHMMVSGEATPSDENSGKPLGGVGAPPGTSLGKLTALPTPSTWWEGGSCHIPMPSAQGADRSVFKLFGPIPTHDGSMAERLGSRTCDQQVAGSNPGRSTAECNPGQVVYTHLAPSHQAVSFGTGLWLHLSA